MLWWRTWRFFLRSWRTVMPKAYDMDEMGADLRLFIADYVGENGFPPTFREMQEHLGVGSTSTIHHIVARMVHNGTVTMVGGKSRTIRLVDDGKDIGGMPGGSGRGAV